MLTLSCKLKSVTIQLLFGFSCYHSVVYSRNKDTATEGFLLQKPIKILYWTYMYTVSLIMEISHHAENIVPVCKESVYCTTALAWV